LGSNLARSRELSIVKGPTPTLIETPISGDIGGPGMYQPCLNEGGVTVIAQFIARVITCGLEPAQPWIFLPPHPSPPPTSVKPSSVTLCICKCHYVFVHFVFVLSLLVKTKKKHKFHKCRNYRNFSQNFLLGLVKKPNLEAKKQLKKPQIQGVWVIASYYLGHFGQLPLS